MIEALAGSDTTCIGDAAVVPLELNNFSDIFKFHVTLSYDTAHLQLRSVIINVHPELEPTYRQALFLERMEVISWEDTTATTLEDNTTFIDLVFASKTEVLYRHRLDHDRRRKCFLQ